jgi:Flp pilus assembly protein TadG
VHVSRRVTVQRGQSLVEFALASIVLVILFGGLVDLTRAIHWADVLQFAAREGALRGATFNAGSASNAYLDDADIKAAVDAELTAGGLPASILRNPGTNCPAVADGNSNHNPPYANSAFPTSANQPWLYICYGNSGALDYPVTPPTTLQGNDLNVILLLAYGPLTSVIPGPLSGNLGIAANLHTRVQGG